MSSYPSDLQDSVDWPTASEPTEQSNDMAWLMSQLPALAAVSFGLILLCAVGIWFIAAPTAKPNAAGVTHPFSWANMDFGSGKPRTRKSYADQAAENDAKMKRVQNDVHELLMGGFRSGN